MNEQDETQASEIYKRIKLSNFLLLTSQGIIFIHSGQEKGRTKLAVSQNSKNIAQFCFDSYNTADSVNAFDWKFSKNQQKLFNYMCSLIEFRKNCDIFSLGTIEKIEQCTKLCKDLCKENLLVYCINYKKKNWFIIANASTNAQKIPLVLKNAKVYVDTSGASLKPLPTPQGIVFEKNAITVEALSAFVISGKV